MTIDEAISKEKEMSAPCSTPCTDKCNCTECRKSHKQLAEWLEELKAYRRFIKMCEERKYIVHSDIFAKDCKEFIAEQLKVGGVDE